MSQFDICSITISGNKVILRSGVDYVFSYETTIPKIIEALRYKDGHKGDLEDQMRKASGYTL